MPAEFAPHEGCLMIWPERGDSWQYGAYAARKAFLRVIETISESESMTVLCSALLYTQKCGFVARLRRIAYNQLQKEWNYTQFYDSEVHLC